MYGARAGGAQGDRAGGDGQPTREDEAPADDIAVLAARDQDRTAIARSRLARRTLRAPLWLDVPRSSPGPWPQEQPHRLEDEEGEEEVEGDAEPAVGDPVQRGGRVAREGAAQADRQRRAAAPSTSEQGGQPAARPAGAGGAADQPPPQVAVAGGAAPGGRR